MRPVSAGNNTLSPPFPVEVFIKGVLASFNSASVCYLILRNYEGLPRRCGHDLDILVARRDSRKAVALIEAKAAQLGWRKVGERKHVAVHKLCFALAETETKVMVFDVVTAGRWKGIPCWDAKSILEKRVSRNVFWVPPPGGEAATLLIEELLASGKVKQRNDSRARAQQLANADPASFLACVSPCFGKRWAKWLLQHVQQGAWSIIESHCQALRWLVIARALLKNPLAQVWRWCGLLWSHVRHRLKMPLGIFVAIIGPDGSGKTTLARCLADRWKQDFAFSGVVHIHGDFKILPRLKRLRHLWARLRGREPPPDPDMTQRHAGASVKPHSLVRSLFYLAYYVWDFLLGHLVIFQHKSKDRLIVADRYFYEYFYQLGNSRLPHWLLHLVRRFIPQPDLIIYIERDACQIYRDKDELTIGEIRRQQQVIRDLLKTLPHSVTVSEVTGIEATLEAVEQQLLERMAARHP